MLATRSDTDALVRDFLAGRTEHTHRAYSAGLRRFAAWAGHADVSDAAADLLGSGPGHANRLVLGWKASMLDRGLSSSSVNGALSAMRSLVKFARVVGAVTFGIDVASCPRRTVSDTTGPDVSALCAMLAAAEKQGGKRGARDAATLRLLANPALRSVEVVRLQLEDVDVVRSRVHVRRKGHRDLAWVTLPPTTLRSVVRWIRHRGLAPGSLFGVTTRTLRRRVSSLGTLAGVGHVRPHSLRHTAVTWGVEAGEKTRGLARFLGHADERTVERYVDAVEDVAGQVAERYDLALASAL